MKCLDTFGFARRWVGAALACAGLGWALPAAANERAAMQACRTDAAGLCAGVKPGGGRIAACLRDNEAKVSPGCRAQLGKLEACAAEVKKLCPQAAGEGELRSCLAAKRTELSAGCRATVGA